MKDEEILGFIPAAYGYLADMAERGDYAAQVLRDWAQEILERIDEDTHAGWDDYRAAMFNASQKQKETEQ